MAVLRLDDVGIVVDDLVAATAFLVELRLEVDGERSVEGPWVDRCVPLGVGPVGRGGDGR